MGSLPSGPEAVPLARVVHGIGNGDGDRGRVPGRTGWWEPTCTARSCPGIRCWPICLLGWATGADGPLDRLEDIEEQILRAERTAAAPSASGGPPRGLRRRLFSARR